MGGHRVSTDEAWPDLIEQNFINLSDGYGDQEQVTIKDYQELNPDGVFRFGLHYGMLVIFEVREVFGEEIEEVIAVQGIKAWDQHMAEVAERQYRAMRRGLGRL